MVVIELIADLLSAVTMLIRAEGDRDKEEAAMMQAQEALKVAADRRKFGPPA